MTDPEVEPSSPRPASLMGKAAAPTAAAPTAEAPDDSTTAAGASTVRPSHPPKEPPPPLFSPLFTLVNNSTIHSTHHPRVHYIFSDDDPEVLSRALAQHQSDEASELAGANKDRAVVLDLAPTAEGGWEVAWASSLSSDWAVVDARVSRMEEGDEGNRLPAADNTDGGLMLKIEGVEKEAASVPPEIDLPSSGSGTQVVGREDYNQLLGEFEKRMGVIRRVVAAGEIRANKMKELSSQPTDTEDQEHQDSRSPADTKG
jgi:hypothetical protein